MFNNKIQINIKTKKKSLGNGLKSFDVLNIFLPSGIIHVGGLHLSYKNELFYSILL